MVTRLISVKIKNVRNLVLVLILFSALFVGLLGQQQVYAWMLTVDLSDSDFGDDRVCASVEGGYGYGPYRLCTQAGRDAEVTFDIGDGIGEGENYRVCGYTPGDLLEIILQSCNRYTHESGDALVHVSA
jgi:hypothetical protein